MSLLDQAFSAAAEEVVPFLDEHVVVAGVDLPLRAYRIEGEMWAQITAMCAPRVNVNLDVRYGYNFQAAARLAAPLSIRVIEDGKETEYDEEQWDRLFKVLSGRHIKTIHSAIWQLNEYDPEQEAKAAAKKYQAALEPKPV